MSLEIPDPPPNCHPGLRRLVDLVREAQTRGFSEEAIGRALADENEHARTITSQEPDQIQLSEIDLTYREAISALQKLLSEAN